jgi:hypothetical protein
VTGTVARLCGRTQPAGLTRPTGEVLVALAGGSFLPLAGGLVVAGRQPGPGGEPGAGGEPGHQATLKLIPEAD